MQLKNPCVLIHIWTKGEVFAVKPIYAFLQNMFYWPLQGGTSFVDHLCYFSLVFVMLWRLFIAALLSPAGKGLTSCFLFAMFNCFFCHFPMWYPG